jgi:hypothetical protein
VKQEESKELSHSKNSEGVQLLPCFPCAFSVTSVLKKRTHRVLKEFDKSNSYKSKGGGSNSCKGGMRKGS